MLQVATDAPPGVIGYEVVGKLGAADYHDTLLPAIEQAAADGEIRIVIVIPEYHGASAGAGWQDLKMGVEHSKAWKRTAVVTDVDWMVRGIQWFGWLTPGDVKHFPLSDRTAAMQWAAAALT